MEEDLTQFERIVDFNIISGQPVRSIAGFPDDEVMILKTQLIIDEFEELMEAIQDRDIDQVAKEAADLIYVIDGLYAALGINRDYVLEEVHESNMSKYTMDEQLAADAVKALNKEHGRGSFKIGRSHPYFFVAYAKGPKTGKVCKDIPCYFPADMSSVVWTDERKALLAKEYRDTVFSKRED